MAERAVLHVVRIPAVGWPQAGRSGSRPDTYAVRDAITTKDGLPLLTKGGEPIVAKNEV